MSVQEIQAALAQLSPVELREVEQSLRAQLQKSEAADDDYAYAMKEYGMTREELQAFEKRQDKINREEREKFEALMGKILTGGTVDLSLLISRQKRAPAIYKSIEGERIPVSVKLDSEASDNRTIIDIEAEDRIGLLYDITQALTELRLDVSLAKILTEKGAAIDTFYVTEENGLKVLDPERRARVEETLREAIARGQLLPPPGEAKTAPLKTPLPLEPK